MARESDVAASSWRDRLPLIAWAGVSLIFLGMLAFGSIEARIWVYGRLTFQRRGIAHVWRYFSDHLPDLPGGPVFPILTSMSLAVLAVGTVVGLGLFLLPGDDPAVEPEGYSPAALNE